MKRDLFLVPDVPEQPEIAEGVESLAWEHATFFSTLSGIEIGSDEFIEVHKDLLENYRETGRHLGFLQHTAMRLVQAILASNKVALVIRKDDSEDEITNNLVYLGHIATSCILWLHAGYPRQWIENTVWEHLDEDTRGIEFPINIPSEGDKDDDN